MTFNCHFHYTHFTIEQSEIQNLSGETKVPYKGRSEDSKFGADVKTHSSLLCPGTGRPVIQGERNPEQESRFLLWSSTGQWPTNLRTIPLKFTPPAGEVGGFFFVF